MNLRFTVPGLNRPKRLSIIMAAATGLLVHCLLGRVAEPALQITQRSIAKEQTVLARLKALDSMKAELGHQWEQIKGRAGADDPQAWLQDLLSFAQDHGIKYDKLQPGPESMGDVSMLLTFSGKMADFVAFVQYLMEEQPFVQIETLKMEYGSEVSIWQFSFSLRRMRSVSS